MQGKFAFRLERYRDRPATHVAGISFRQVRWISDDGIFEVSQLGKPRSRRICLSSLDPKHSRKDWSRSFSRVRDYGLRGTPPRYGSMDPDHSVACPDTKIRRSRKRRHARGRMCLLKGCDHRIHCRDTAAIHADMRLGNGRVGWRIDGIARLEMAKSVVVSSRVVIANGSDNLTIHLNHSIRKVTRAIRVRPRQKIVVVPAAMCGSPPRHDRPASDFAALPAGKPSAACSSGSVVGDIVLAFQIPHLESDSAGIDTQS